jgi:hypothetical protein
MQNEEVGTKIFAFCDGFGSRRLRFDLLYMFVCDSLETL